MKIPTSVSLVPAPILLGASSASAHLALYCLIMDADALIPARVSASQTLKMESALYPKLSTPPRPNAAVVKCRERAGGTPVSCAPKMTKLLSRTCVLMATEQFQVFMILVKMSTNALRAQAFVQMVSVSIQMGLFAVNAQWVTTWIILEYAVWILMNVPLAIHVGMVHAPMLLGVLNATAMKALSQGL